MISIVYHAYLVGEWKTLVQQQLGRLINSGLYDAADQIWVTANIAKNDEKEVREYFLKYPKLQIEYFNDNYAEYPGIKKVKEIGNKYNTKIFYFHTKGVSNNWIKFNSKEICTKKIENVAAWRECLEYFLIDNWKDCVDKLDTHDNVGVSCNGGWYWGNFWWSQSSHIKKTREVGLWSRWDYEAWLNMDTPESKNYEFYHIGYNAYLSNILPEFYNGSLNKKYQNKKIVVKKAVYGTPPFEIDEGYSTTPLNLVVDVTETVRRLLDKYDGLCLKFNVNNETMGGDPIHGNRKCLMIQFAPEGEETRVIELGITEGHDVDFRF